MNVRKVKSQIKKLAEKFDLRYNPNWFRIGLRNFYLGKDRSEKI